MIITRQRTTLFLISLLLCSGTSFGQTQKVEILPVIQASSTMVDIKDGDAFRKNAWTITPEAKPDVYPTSSKGKKVTFYTDKDSISFPVKAGGVYNFIILLKGKDTALTQIKYVESKLDILKKGNKYNLSDNIELPAFSYQSMDDSNLVALRKGFKLDSIAGEGLEISKILNLLHWIHNLIPNDGNHDNPTVKNAMSMIAVCKKDNRGLNCRGLSTVLNECYLALGISSKFVTCMPKDSVYDDCHVINAVYSKDFKKWIWIDPTNNAYVMNEKGELQSIEEVRERLINGKPLIVNPDANWNNRSTITKEEYLYNYMAKNLYRIEVPLVSEYDYETWKYGKQVSYIELLPLDAYHSEPEKTQHTNKITGTNFTNYKTNNPKRFWALPE
jgi:hypothetical protein